MLQNRRMMRINDEIKRYLAEIIRLEIRDPRLDSMINILKVKTSVDLEHCIVYVSVFSGDKKEIIKILNSAAGFIKKMIAEKINLRVTPNFKFVLDDSIEYSMKINDLFNKIKVLFF